MKNKIIIYILTAVLLSLAVFVPVKFADDNNVYPFYVVISTKEKSEKVNCWKNEKGEYYVFLPSFSKQSDVAIYLNTDTEVFLDETELKDGMSCENFELNVPYTLTYSSFGKVQEYKTTFVKSENMPSVYIDTESGNMDYIHSKKGNEEKGKISLYKPDGSIDYSGDLESINGRGNSTWEFYEKKPYSIKLKNEADLLNLGSANRWVLLSNAADSSNLRNKLVYDFADKIGINYSPDCEWVDLYLNGEYYGLYLLSERNEIHKSRVDIDYDNSFLVSLEYEYKLAEQNRSYIVTDNNQALRIHNYLGDTDELKKEWQIVENAILSQDNIDDTTETLLWDVIDLDSWSRKYLLEEIFANFDACFVSQYFYRDGKNGKICAGPVWDYDLSLGRKSTHQINVPEMFIANRPFSRPGYATPWFNELYSSEEFYDYTVNIYEKDFLPALNELLNNDIDTYQNKLYNNDYMNKIRWFMSEDSLFEQIEYLKEYLNSRIEFLNNVWLNNKEYYTVTVNNGEESYFSYYCGYIGEPLKQLPDFKTLGQNVFVGWYYVDTDEPFDITKPIYEDTAIYAKWQEKSGEKVKDILKLVPLAVISVLFVAFFVIDIKRNRVAKK